MGLLFFIMVSFIVWGTAIILNWKYQWITKEWINSHDFEFVLLLIAFIFWPIGVICLCVMGVITLIHNYLIPD